MVGGRAAHLRAVAAVAIRQPALSLRASHSPIAGTPAIWQIRALSITAQHNSAIRFIPVWAKRPQFRPYFVIRPHFAA